MSSACTACDSPSPPSVATRKDEAKTVAVALAKALEQVNFAGWDPYDALSSAGLCTLARTATLRTICVQAIKRSPINVRPLLGIHPRRHTKGLALLVSAFARLAQIDPTDYCRTLGFDLAHALRDRAVRTRDGAGWAYDFNVQTRWGAYAAGEPNAIATSFAAHALLDAHELLGADDLADGAVEASRFARAQLAREMDGETYFAYYTGSDVAIHNANVLLASVVLRAEPEHAGLAERAYEFTLRRQRPDGSWPYGDSRGLGWVDGFHTAYVLDAIDALRLHGAPVRVESALRRGLSFYLERLIDPDGAPRASIVRRYPVDVHAASAAITTLSRLKSVDPRADAVCARVLEWTLTHMRRPDGRFAFQQHRLYRNSIPYVRWSDAHMLRALAVYLECLGG